MVKFSREYEASIIPEWKAAFVDYKGLKKLIKKIKISRRDDDSSTSSALIASSGAGDRGESESESFSFSVLDPVRALAARLAPRVQALGPNNSVRVRVDGHVKFLFFGKYFRATKREVLGFLHVHDMCVRDA